jgi:hypothetical protein
MAISYTVHGTSDKSLRGQIADRVDVADGASSPTFPAQVLIRIYAVTDSALRIGPPTTAGVPLDATKGEQWRAGSASERVVNAGDIVKLA